MRDNEGSVNADPSDYSWADNDSMYNDSQFPQATAYAYDLAITNPEETVGHVDYIGWYAMVYLSVSQSDMIQSLDWKRDADAAPESVPVAVIVVQDQQGQVTAAFYDGEESFQADWDEIQGMYEGFYRTNKDIQH